MTHDSDTVRTGPRLRGWMVWLAPLIAVVVVAAGLLVVIMSGRSTSDSTATFHRGKWQPPTQTVLASSMRVRPIPGWRTNVENLGLPESGMFTTSDIPNQSQPFIGSVANNGYFLASSPGPVDRQSWLVGLDVHTGRQLFNPVKIDAGPGLLECFLNGPALVLCIADGVREGAVESTAWVIEASTGKVSFNGPTKLRAAPGSGATVVQVGIYAVSQVRGEGIYGIGPDTETTWFVSDKSVAPTKPTADTAPPTLAAARDSAPGSDRMVVFSLVDGKVITPDLGDGLSPLTAIVYPGGFAFEAVADTRIRTPDLVVFFDDAGNRLGETHVSGFLDVLSMALPMVKSAPSYTIFGANGAGLIQLPGEGLGPDAVLIGHRLYAPESTWEGPVKVRRWRQFDLTTGQEGNACRPNMSGYIANDGSVGIFETAGYEVAGATTFGMDLATCEKLWTSPVNPDSFHRLWRIDDTLVDLSDDGRELHSLVTPG